MFVSRGFSDAEDLADLTIKRVTDLLPGMREEQEEDVRERAPYFYKVARYIILEARRRPEIATDVMPVSPLPEEKINETYERLLKCLELLSEEKRELILDYHLYKGRDKIVQHERMSEELGISVEALRSRAHHLRKTLKKCVRRRRKEVQEKRKASWKSFLQRQ